MIRSVTGMVELGYTFAESDTRRLAAAVTQEPRS
jgi:hypothetical protein